jgi:hypothetical protein
MLACFSSVDNPDDLHAANLLKCVGVEEPPSNNMDHYATILRTIETVRREESRDMGGP